MKIALFLISFFLITNSEAFERSLFWTKIKANTKQERTKIANLGVSIEQVAEDYVVALVDKQLLETLEKKVDVTFRLSITDDHIRALGFPKRDERYHDYNELMAFIDKIAQENPHIVEKQIIGKSHDGRDIVNLRISTDLKNSDQKPAISIMGGHHAREHLSVEIPIELIRYLVTEFENKNPIITRLIESREIHIAPLINPDGAEYDISHSHSYRFWRKNLSKNHDGSFGVDLNRNYGHKWGTGGSSSRPRSDVYKGTSPFSEPETKAVKEFIEKNQNIQILLSFHTFSQLILYPWGHTYQSISNKKDLMVHKKMAETMSQWNGYAPMQSSDLYIASGDTTDWSYGVHGIFSFTFELDPARSFGRKGFYPGDIIDQTFQKNLKPLLYLIERSDNPYRVLTEAL